MTSPDHESHRSLEARGWFTLLVVMFLFPILFFLCVFFPIWIDVATPYWFFHLSRRLRMLRIEVAAQWILS